MIQDIIARLAAEASPPFQLIEGSAALASLGNSAPRVFDSAGTAVARSMDWVATGFGKIAP